MKIAVYHTATPEQLARAEKLASQWQAEANDPIVLIGATVTALINTIDKSVPEEEYASTIEAIHRALRENLL